MADPAALNVRESVGAALRFVRANQNFIGMVALIAAGVSGVLALVMNFVPQLGFVLNVVSLLVTAIVYAALVATALHGTIAARANLWLNGGRVWSAMVIVGFFLSLVMLVLMMPVAMVLSVVLAPYQEQLNAAGQDQAALLAVMSEIAAANPVPLLLATLFMAGVWLLLSSRLYLAAPASVELGRILTFETWNWTKGAMLKIVWARLMLLLPAYVLWWALSLIAARLMGIGSATTPLGFSGLVQADGTVAALWVVVSTLIVTAVYSSLEAGLSAALYRELKPSGAPVASTDSDRAG